jgi:hypothetical protein
MRHNAQQFTFEQLLASCPLSTKAVAKLEKQLERKAKKEAKEAAKAAKVAAKEADAEAARIALEALRAKWANWTPSCGVADGGASFDSINTPTPVDVGLLTPPAAPALTIGGGL